MNQLIARRTLLRSSLILGTALPLVTPAFVFAQSQDAELLRSVNPELRPLAAQMLPYFRSAPPWSRANLAANRKSMRAYVRSPLPDVPHERHQVPGSRGQPDVTVYVINAKPGTSRPAI